ncbi:hypothetical protein GDO86_011204 [Hymenochirus boettgeri]|uniref:MANSC domain-containing protein n=1 Tax=Hymenochirus boettgeri TaxID=247094 RepID=A0A8T2JFG6_9PIPI|nr:hypothetical protein GDO86_011204 [Hymenochirus boettgeri]
MRLYTYFIWLCTVMGCLSEQCQEGATFTDSVISLNLKATHIMRVPNAWNMSDCLAACCNHSGCDLSWMLGRRCFIVNCQHKESCEPQKIKHMNNVKSYLSFILRPSARFMPLTQNLETQNGFSLEDHDKPDQVITRLKELSLLSKNPSLDKFADYTDDYNKPQHDLFPLNAKTGLTESQDLDYVELLLPDTERGTNSSAVETGRQNWESGEEKMSSRSKAVSNVSEPPKAIHISPTVMQAEISIPQPTEPIQHLTVSNETEIIVILPKDEVEMNVFVIPEAPADLPYSYEWSLISQPVDYHGKLETKNAQSFRLSKLSPGMYLLKVSVSNKNSFGEGYVNVTVKPATRANQPPLAVVSPKAQEISLPNAFAFIDGRQSTDDGKIVTYLWEEIEGPTGKHKSVGDSSFLHVTELVTGNYTFRLTVTDNEGAINSTTAHVTVSKPVDHPPIANAGSNQIITLPQNYITLNGNQSSDDHQIVSYEWSLSPNSKGKVVAMQGVRSPYLHTSAMQEGEYMFLLMVSDSSRQQSSAQVTVTVQPGSGPSEVAIQDSDKAVGLVTGLQVGMYTFRLTVKDQQGLSSIATLSVTVKQENSPLKANAGGSHIIVLPDNSIILDGSKSRGDQDIVSYLWKRDDQSPAAGHVLYYSDHDPVLQLTNLVEGIYLFHLTVTDSKGETDMDTASVEVRPDPQRQNLVEVILQVGVGKLTEQQKDTMVRQLAVLLNVLDSDIKVQKIAAHSDLSTVLLFYIQNGHPPKIHKAADVAQTLQNHLLKEKADFLLYKVLRVDTAACLLKCSGHGHCDPITKSCLCYPFWVENLIQRYISDGESNCEWSVLYITIITVVFVAFLIAVIWLFICCCQSRKRTKIRKKAKYTILDNIDEQERLELRPKYGIKHRSTEHNSSLMVSESEFESDQDTIFSRDNVRRVNTKHNGIGSIHSAAPFNFNSRCR